MQHRIRRQILELDLPREEGARALAREASRLFQEKVLPRLDDVFTRLAPADRYVRIDRLEIDLSSLPERDFEQHFVTECIAQLDRQVSALVAEAVATASGGAASAKTGPQRAVNILEEFLISGTLPWHAQGQSLAALEKVLEEPLQKRHPNMMAIGRRVVTGPIPLLKRLVWQFSPAFAENVIALGLAVAPERLGVLLRLIEDRMTSSLSPRQRLVIWRAILDDPPRELLRTTPTWKPLVSWLIPTPAWAEIAIDLRPEAHPSEAVVRTAVKGEMLTEEAAVQNNLIDDTEELQKEQPPTSSLSPEGQIAPLAGLVLLSPYLASFFGNLSATPVAEEPESAFRAVHLLYYLATGFEHPEEPELLMLKLLCGVPAEAPVPRELDLTTTEKEESDNLLRAVIQNWPVLKNTSPEGLRTMFLQRGGLIYPKKGSADLRLVVERKSQDLLLERLPWGYSMLKFPWTDHLLNVEW